jgi:hypothetical protein
LRINICWQKTRMDCTTRELTVSLQSMPFTKHFLFDCILLRYTRDCPVSDIQSNALAARAMMLLLQFQVCDRAESRKLILI